MREMKAGRWTRSRSAPDRRWEAHPTVKATRTAAKRRLRLRTMGPRLSHPRPPGLFVTHQGPGERPALICCPAVNPPPSVPPGPGPNRKRRLGEILMDAGLLTET